MEHLIWIIAYIAGEVNKLLLKNQPDNIRGSMHEIKSFLNKIEKALAIFGQIRYYITQLDVFLTILQKILFFYGGIKQWQ